MKPVSRSSALVVATLALVSLGACSSAQPEAGSTPTAIVTPSVPADLETDASRLESPSPSASAVSASSELPPDSPGPLGPDEYIAVAAGGITDESMREWFDPLVFENTEEGAFQTAFTYLAVLDNMYETQSISLAQALSGPECDWCESWIHRFRGIADASLRATGGALTPIGGEFYGQLDEPGRASVTIGVREEELKVWYTDGTLAETLPAREVWYQMTLSFEEGRWMVTAVDNATPYDALPAEAPTAGAG